MSTLIAALALATTAAPAAPPAPATPVATAVDPARSALAKTTVDHIWPAGTLARMMRGTFDQVMDNAMMSAFDIKLADMAKAAGIKPEAGEADLTLRQVMEKLDPHFEERMRITNKVLAEEMVPIMAAMEPHVREGLVRAYAAKFDSRQLSDMNAFFATPSGKAYAAESMLLLADPEVMASMNKVMPDMMKAMPAMMKKLVAATAHLPPPPKSGKDVEAFSEDSAITS